MTSVSANSTKRRWAWWLYALLWAVSSAIAGPVLFAAVVSLASFPRVNSTTDFVGSLLGGFILMAMTFLVVSIVLLPGYVVLLLSWAWIGPRLGRVEERLPHFLAAAAALAFPAAAAVAMANRNSEPLSHGASAFVGAWIGLVVPRLVSPRLRLGSFSQ